MSAASGSPRVARVLDISKRLKNSFMIERDLAFVERAAGEILELPEAPRPHEGPPSSEETRAATIANALWIAAAVAYERCFNTTRQRQGLRRHRVKNHPANREGIHDFMLRARNTHFAHPGSEDLEKANLTLMWKQDAPDAPLTYYGHTVLYIKMVGGTREQAQQLQGLASALVQEMQAEIKELTAMLTESAQALTPSEIGEMNPQKAPPA